MEKNNKEIYYMIKNNENGVYVVATTISGQEISDIENWLIEDEWLGLGESDREILNFINKSNKKEIYGDWDNIWGEDSWSSFSNECEDNPDNFVETYLNNEAELVELLIDSGKLINEKLENVKVVRDNNYLILEIKENLENDRKLLSSFILNGEFSDFLIIDDKYAYRDSTIYELKITNNSLYELTNLQSQIVKDELEQYLSLFYTNFEGIELRCLDYSEEVGGIRGVKPALVIDKIAQDNSLYIRLDITISSMGYIFLKENGIEKVGIVNTMEKKIVKQGIDLSGLEEATSEIVKALVKHQKSIKVKQSYYLDDNNSIILQEKLAKEFIGKELLRLAAKYRVVGTEKLKKYNIKTVKPKIIGSFKHGIDFLEGEVQLEIDGENFSVAEILSTYQKDSYVVLSDGTNALINYKYIEKLQRLFKDSEDNKVKISFFDLPLIDELIDDKVLNEEFKKSKNFFTGINSISERDSDLPRINAKLREYQEYGYKWLSYLIDNNLGGCLADDMGLGKTLQAIAILSKVHFEKGGRSLVVMPKSLIYNWENEVAKFSPSLKTGIYYGNNRDLKILDSADVILTTYGTIRNDIEKLKEFSFELVILDESQNIKNVNAQTTKAIMLLNSKNRVALSGTPIENNLSELYSLFRFLNPTMFGTLDEFNHVYANPIQKENDREVIDELRKKIYPFILRRVKKEVLKDLPDKIEKTLFIEMNKEQKKFYDERRSYYYKMVSSQIKEQGLGKTQFYILQALNELRQITSCPESKNEKIISSKRQVLIEQVADAVANGHKVLVFTNYINSIENICKDLESRDINYLSMTGATKDRQGLVDKFQKDSKYKVFVMTLKTGGVGLNLTSADTIFIYDPWWNKTVENQAIDRAYRLGQDRTVFANKLILKDTIEEKILKLQQMKSELLDSLISEDNTTVKFLTEKDIEFILGD